MENFFTESAHSKAFAFFVLLSVCVIQLVLLIFSRKMVGIAEDKDSISPERLQLKRFLSLKLFGFLIMGIIPFIIFYILRGPDHYFLKPGSATWQIPGFLIPAIPALILFINFFAAGKNEFYARFPQMRISEWGIPNLLISIFGWGIYLVGYEYLFRGLFLSAWVQAFGPTTAILVNVVIYSLAHIPNGVKESIGAVPFGIILCLLTIQTGSFVTAFLLHWVLSASAEIFSVHHHPEMQFNLKKIYLWKDIS